MDEVHKNKVVLEYLEAVTEAVIKAQELDADERVTNLRGVLYYWMGIIFDEGRVNASNLEVANDALRQMVARLKHQNKELLKRVNKDR